MDSDWLGVFVVLGNGRQHNSCTEQRADRIDRTFPVLHTDDTCLSGFSIVLAWTSARLVYSHGLSRDTPGTAQIQVLADSRIEDTIPLRLVGDIVP